MDSKPLVALLHAFDRLVPRLLRSSQSVSRLAAGATRDLTRTRAQLLAENALLRHQVVVLRRNIERPRLHGDDRLLLLSVANSHLRRDRQRDEAVAMLLPAIVA